MVNTPAQAVARANGITAGYGGYCLRFVKECYNAPAVYPSACACWQGQSQWNVPTSSLNGIPVGAPIFFAPVGDPYGHIAIYLGGGMMRTTYQSGNPRDPLNNRIHTMAVSRWQSWGYRLLGWSKAIENQPIPGLATPAPTPDHNTNPTVSTKGDTDMFGCIVWIDDNHAGYNKGLGCYFSPATGVIPLPSRDCISVLNRISQHYTGKNLPEIHSNSKAPWVIRLQQASVQSPHAPKR